MFLCVKVKNLASMYKTGRMNTGFSRSFYVPPDFLVCTYITLKAHNSKQKNI